MTIRMKALKDFRGNHGEGNIRGSTRLVEAGVEFAVASQKRAHDLEIAGLAVPMFVQKAAPPHQNKMEPTLHNKAAGDGPLDFPGGATGAPSAAASSSPPGQVPEPFPSNRRGARRGS